MVDGLMAKITGTASNWGAFLDSTSDRLGDAAVFGGVLLFFAYRGLDCSGPGSPWPVWSSASGPPT